MNTASEWAAAAIVRDIPESAWDVAAWDDLGWESRSVDVADRVRLVTVILAAADLLVQPTADEAEGDSRDGLAPDHRAAIVDELGGCGFHENLNDASMCLCGLPALGHDDTVWRIVLRDHPAITAGFRRHDPDAGLRERVEAVEVVHGFVTHDDGSQSPVERWVRASDDRWVSLDSERQTRRDLTWVMDPAEVEDGVFSDPSIHRALTARGRTPDCLPFCQGGLHEEGCAALAADTPTPAPKGSPDSHEWLGTDR